MKREKLLEKIYEIEIFGLPELAQLKCLFCELIYTGLKKPKNKVDRFVFSFFASDVAIIKVLSMKNKDNEKTLDFISSKASFKLKTIEDNHKLLYNSFIKKIKRKYKESDLLKEYHFYFKLVKEINKIGNNKDAEKLSKKFKNKKTNQEMFPNLVGSILGF